MVTEMSTQPVKSEQVENLELPVPDLLRRARPLPPPNEMVIEDTHRRRRRRLPRRLGGVTTQPPRGPIVIDTDVYGAQLVAGSALAAIYDPIIVGRPAFISFQTAAELRYGAMRRNWGEIRMRKLEARIASAETVHTGPDLVLTYALLRVNCERIGHALGQREHNADRWIAATAIRLGVPLVSNDGIFNNVPGLLLESATNPLR